MSNGKGIYNRGPFWLDFDRGAGGRPTSSSLYIWWYDARRGRQRRKSTGTADVRVACDALDAHFLATHRPSDQDRDGYLLSDLLADYHLEHGSGRDSADAIKARLKHVQRFIDREVDAGRLDDPVTVEAIDDSFVERFRAWLLAEPIVARKKNAKGEWVDGKARPRAASTVEESLIQLKAALNHAHGKRRIRYVPPFKHKTRAEVTAPRNDRVSVQAMGELLDYTLRGAGRYGGHAARLLPLRRYIIAAVTTLARPDAILDMSVIPERAQWLRDDLRYALNPAGRVQTKKHRPIVPAGELLTEWLGATDAWFICYERTREGDDGEPVIDQVAVKSIRSAWDTMRDHLKLPATWGPKLLRHSMATELRRRRVDPWELSGQLGHRLLRTSETYAAFAPDYLGTVQAGIADVLADLSKSAAAALHPKLTRKDTNVVDFDTVRRA